MSNDTKPPAPAKPAAKAAEAADSKAAARSAPKPAGKLPAFDERPLRFSDLAPYAAQLDAGELIGMLRDGRGLVRANAALGLAAVGTPALDLVMLLRDSEPRVAATAAESISLLGEAIR